MATDIYDLSGDVSRRTLVSLFGRLEPMWRESWERVRIGPGDGTEHERWAAAATRLEEALVDLERFAGTVDPGLGKRHWPSRRPPGPWVSAERQASGDGVVLRISSP